MLARAAGVVALSASALSASAFLIPAGIVEATHDGLAALAAAPDALPAKQWALQLPCSECAFPPGQENIEDVGSDNDVSIQGGANSIVVDFTISEDGQQLQLNGEAIYPVGFQVNNMLAQRIHVDQVPSSASWEDIMEGKAKTMPLAVTGSQVSTMEDGTASPEGHMLIPVKYTIFELEQQPVSLYEVSIQLLKTASGELFIANLAGVKAAPPQEHGVEKECRMLPLSLCRLRNMFEDKIARIKNGGLMQHGLNNATKKGGCHGQVGGRPHGGMALVEPSLSAHNTAGSRKHDRPRHERPHGHHHGHRWLHSFLSGLVTVLVPTLAGVAVGISVSIAGLLICRIVAFLWTKFYRGGRQGYQRVQIDERFAAHMENEKTPFLVDEEKEPLPAYEA